MAATIGLVQGQPRAFSFAPGVRSDLRLLQVDETLLQEIVEKGVVVKGAEDEEAVLCTSQRTYAMKLVETTNLQLLVRPSETAAQFRSADSAEPIQVAATSGSHIELVEVAPRLGPLRRLLWERPYGPQDEGEGADGDGDTAMAEAEGPGGRRAAGYTFDELLAEVQASPAELRAALAAEGAVELDGRWRAVEGGYLGELLEMVLLTAQQAGMPLGALRGGELLEALRADGYHPNVVGHCLTVYARRVDAGAAGSAEAGPAAAGDGVWAVDETKVCIHFAHKVLAAARGSMPLQDFTAAWARAVPAGMSPRPDMLAAEALVDGTGPEARISAFPAAALPHEPAERFAALFRRRPRWEWTHLEPYLAGLKVPGQSVEALLIRFARASQPTPDAPLVYSAR
ncbi:hypothetical protein GPECTOR_7g1200 [Gonium pectorale]|uniref:Sister chromatid cohesion protein DCC1 n=1 Tax=Gonium pectorale TaxID=33097 RepID=A0A150GTV5_GONPE|nr:hypothetical protein GPECTOR_7g1200 [Gonium pectorale]|eukprot:KXZ53306.1 hypothetical protein GPECTOR_7g1200 [Gonium pectorale]